VDAPSLKDLAFADAAGSVPPDAPVLGVGNSLLHAAKALAAKRCELGRLVDDSGEVGIVSIYDLVAALPDDDDDDTVAPAVVLQFRRMGEGQRMLAEFQSIDDAVTWLSERPKFVEVLGVEEPVLTPDVDTRLREAMRPLDDEELAKQQEIDKELDRQHKITLQKMQAEAEAEAQPYTGSTNPDRPMRIRYEKGKSLENADPNDDRPLTDVARNAVQAWVAERNEWMHPRKKHVGAAVLTVWPGPIPGGDEADRIRPGPQVDVLPGFASDET
jgi:CBS domain-containing protein